MHAAPPLACAGPDARQVFVKTLTGKTITVSINLDSMVEQLKQSIFEMEGENMVCRECTTARLRKLG